MLTWNRAKVAITGATGFVGHHVALQLRRQGADVVALVRSGSKVGRLREMGSACQIVALEDPQSMAAALGGCECLFHVAGAVGFGSEWANFFQVNVQGTQNVLAAVRRAGVRRLIHTSSIVAVGASTAPAILDENCPWDLGRFRVPYVSTKRWAEDAALTGNDSGLEVVVVNPASVVGPDDFSGSEFGTLCRRFWRGRIPFHFGGGNNFVDVRDVAAGHLLAAQHGRPGQRYLLAGENRSYQAFFLDLCRAARRAIPRLRLPDFLAPWIGMVNERWRDEDGKRPYLSSAQAALAGLFFFFDSSKARNELGYRTRPLQQTLADAHSFWLPRKSA